MLEDILSFRIIVLGVFFGIVLNEWKNYSLDSHNARDIVRLYCGKSKLFFIGLLTLLLFDPIVVPIVAGINASEVTVFFAVGSLLGKNINFWSVAIAMYLVTRFYGSALFRRFLFGALCSSAISGLVVAVLKEILLRARPQLGFGAYSFFNFLSHSAYHDLIKSMPSGDVALVSAASFYLILKSRSVLLNFVMTALTICTSISRIHLLKHWPSDIFFSLAISLFVSRITAQTLIFVGTPPEK